MSRGAALFTQTVPRSERTFPEALDLYRALRSSATLRRAVEQIRAEETRTVWRTGTLSRYPSMTGDEPPNFLFDPALYHGGKRWNWTQERAVRRRVFDALVSWRLLRDPDVYLGAMAATVVQYIALLPEETAAIALDLVRELRSTQRMLNHPAWQWFGLTRDDVSRELFRAQSHGLLRFDECGSVAELRFYDAATGAMYDAAEAAK